ncbi:AMP-binding protein [Streptomyces sp. NRRL S-87]|uniref:AMP-binding protein n=1 Tax=Streptomyces sp. NRRL S-87 TaxID=1463920 RepID=UPI0004C2955A|nr:AMP-binding protein [Streptomyces sp. NRRL S-87]
MTQETESYRPGPRSIDTVTRLFERWARDTPDAPALITPGARLSYGELARRANRLAHHLRAGGLPAGGTVAVALTRPADLLTALLGALEAGAAYTVLDPDSPRTATGRLAAARPHTLVTTGRHRIRLEDGAATGDRAATGGGLRVVALDAEAGAVAAHPAHAPDVPAAVASDPAAVLFPADGGTRAVTVTHARLLAAHEGWAEVCRLTPEDRHLITAPADVVPFAAGWTRALCTGGALVVPSDDRAFDRAGRADRGADAAGPLRRLVADEEVTLLHTDPEAARLLFTRGSGGGPDPALWPLRVVTVTGDRLFLDQQAALQRGLHPGVRLLNVYGTAETAGVGTRFELGQLAGPVADPERLSLLGTPFPGWTADTADGLLRLAPPDGGDAIPTGDHATLRGDGLLEYRGRDRDRIRAGRRTVDTYRVESAIRGHHGVGDVVVTTTDEGVLAKRLTAYIAPAGPPGIHWIGPPDLKRLRAHLDGQVPEEDVPKAVVHVRELPRNRAGQVDRGALPQPPASQVGSTGGKYGSVDSGTYTARTGERTSRGCLVGCAFVAFVVLIAQLTDVFWPGSTDLTYVPWHYAVLFRGLYAFECLAFTTGLLFLFTGRSRMLRTGRPRRLTTAAHLALVWLLASWWPQDNFYRLAAKNDWPQQAALVYTFNVPLMIAAAVVAVWATSPPVGGYEDRFDA